MSKFKVPKKWTFNEYENVKKEIEKVSKSIKNKIAIEHNNVIKYIEDKERIVFDRNVHKYSYFLYTLEENSLKEARKYLENLKYKYNRLEILTLSDLLIVGDYGTWDGDEIQVSNHELVQNLLVRELLDKRHIDRLIEVVYSQKVNLYHIFYIQLHDAMISTGYSFDDKTIRKIARNLDYSLSSNFKDTPKKKDISDKIPLKVYTPPPFRKTSKSMK